MPIRFEIVKTLLDLEILNVFVSLVVVSDLFYFPISACDTGRANSFGNCFKLNTPSREVESDEHPRRDRNVP